MLQYIRSWGWGEERKKFKIGRCAVSLWKALFQPSLLGLSSKYILLEGDFMIFYSLVRVSRMYA